MQRIKTYTHSFIFGISFFVPKVFITLLFLWLVPFIIEAQITLEGGDIAVLGVNANNNACSGSSGSGEDVVTFVSFKDITNGTEIDLTDNGWERSVSNRWGDSEGALRCTYSGGTISAGTSFNLIFRGDLTATQAANPSWTITDLNLAPVGTLNLNSGGDQIYVMQGGVWDNMGTTGDHDATYTGKILYGFNTRTFWAADGTSQQSNLHPDVNPCYFMNPTGGTTNYVNYTGPTSPTSQLEWINRIKDPGNWSSYVNCTAYNSSPPPAAISITSSGMSIECAVCTGCGTVNDVLTFNLPSSGGPFNVVYTDGTLEFNLSSISNGHTENVSVTSNTTFSLVSVTDINGCPVFSNFEGEAVISQSGSGGNANITGGGVLCVGNCTEVTFLVTGGEAPYNIDMNVALGPFNLDFTIPVPNTNFTINVCSDDVLIPEWNAGTNTLTLPDFVVSNLVLTLLSMTDNSGCAGTVDSTPLDIDIEETPTANSAGPLEDCDDGSGAATFNLSSLDNTVNGGSGNMVNWYSDMSATIPIGTPGTYNSPSTTVYATVTQGSCESDPVPVNLIVNAVPTPSPTSDQACDDGTGFATFNLNSLDVIINGGSGDLVSWYFDIGGSSPIPVPSSFNTGSTTVYATISVGICESGTVPVILTVNPSPLANIASDQACDEGGGIATFDLTTLDNTVSGGTGNPVSWFTDPGGSFPIINPANHVAVSGFVYASVSNGLCSSPIVQITLTVNPSPTANPTNDTQCDDGSGSASFNLTLLDFIVNGGTGATVSWYLDIGATFPIPDPTDFQSSGGPVWAVVTNGLCESNPVEILLDVSDAPFAIATNDQACDNGSGSASFDLTTLDIIVNGGTGNTVTWYFDISGTVSIPDPSNYISTGGSVYANVDNGFCTSPLVEIILSLSPLPTANIAAAENCDDGSGSTTFNLTTLDIIVNGGSGMTVNWYFDMNGDLNIPDPSNFSTPTNLTIYATVFDGLCESQTVAVDLSIVPAPIANPTSSQGCDDGSGSTIFDLTTLDNTVNGGNGNAVSWFSDSNGDTPITDPVNFDSGSASVFASVSNGACTSEIVEITLTLEDQPEANIANDQDCDDGSGSTIFDLTTLDNTVNGGNGNAVSWFTDSNGDTPITDPANFDSGSASVFASVSNGACTSEIVEITLTLEAQPEANIANDQDCDDGSGSTIFDLTTLDNTVNGGNGNAVSWFSDSNGDTPITDPANFDSGSASVFASVSNGACTSEIVEITLTLEAQPEANIATDQDCDDGSGSTIFDLTTLDNTVNGGNGNAVSWFSDSNGDTPITDPVNFDSGSASVFASVSNGACSSEIVEITLTLEAQPEANIATDQDCDDGSGSTIFDLTTLDNTVNGGNGNAVSWFSDSNGDTPITDPVNFDSGSASVFASVSNGACSSEIVEITLTLEDQPEANIANDQDCDDGSGSTIFDLTTLDNTVNGGNGNAVSWFSDSNGDTPITDPVNFDSGSASVFASVSNGACTSEIVEITLTLEDQPEANIANDQDCDDGSGSTIFDLTTLDNTVNGGNGNSVSWFTDSNGDTPITDPANFDSGSTSVFASVSNGACSSEIVEITLTLEAQPEANATSTEACDEGSGAASFNLDALETTVNGGTSNNVQWFEDMDATLPISSPYNTGTSTIYALVNNGNCISEVVAISLTVSNEVEANPTSIEACADINDEGLFDLLTIESTVNGGTANSVNWFEDMAGMVSITPPYTSTNSTIYAIVGDGVCASEAVAINLIVNSVPEAAPASSELCDEGNNTAVFDLSILENTVNVGSGNDVAWYEDVNATIPINSPFSSNTAVIYAVVNNGNCFASTVAVSLTVNELPTAIPTTADDCDDGNGMASFDLSTLESTINDGTANQVNFFEDINGTIPVTSPFNTTSTTIYAIVGNGDCVSIPVEVNLNVSDAPIAIPTAADDCDDGNGMASFDLSTLESTINDGTANQVNFFENINGTIPVASPFNTTSTTIYAIVGNGDCVSIPVEVNLNVSDAPVAIPTAADDCDDGNGIASFDLSTLESTINDGTANQVNFFEDINGTIPVTSPFNTTSTTIYAIVGNGDCVSIPVEVNLNVSDAPIAIPTAADDCDDGNGMASFDLSTLESTINDGTANQVNFFEDINGTIPVTSPFNTTSTTIYAIVGNGDCVSIPVEVNLNVSDAPIAIPTAADDCDDGNGMASFDLSTLESTINDGTANQVNFFEDINGTIPVTSPFNTASTTIYAIVGNGDCVSIPVEVNLNVSDAPAAIPTAADDCDDGNGMASFDLSTLESTINDGTANQVNFFEDINGTIPVTSPFNTVSSTIYAIVGNGDCVSFPVEVNLNVSDAPVAIPTAADDCDDGNGMASFDLSTLESTINDGTANQVNFFEDINGTIPVASPFNTASTTIYAIVGNGDCVSLPVEVNLNVSDAPVAIPTVADDCDDGNGMASFDLSTLESTINDGTANQVNFFEDINGTIPVTSPFNTVSTTIYAIVGNGDCVSFPVEVNLNVSDAPIAIPTTADDCDDGNGMASFDLSTLESTINDGTANQVNFFEDINGTIPVASPFNTASTTIYAIVGNGDCVSLPVEVNLNVSDAPVAIPTAADDCDDGNGMASFDLSTLESTINDGTANQVNFFEDINGTIPVASPFNTASTTIYAIVGNGDCLSIPVEVNLNVSDAPIAIPTTADDCDDGNGMASFDLSTLESTINDGTANQVNFFEDINGTIPVASPFNTASTTIYAIVGNGDCVSFPVEVNLNVSDAPVAIPTAADDCDDGNGMASFDLSTLESTINDGTANQVNFFEDINGTIPVTSPFNTTSTTIYAIVGNGNCVSLPVEVNLNVSDAPVAIPTVADDCDDGNGMASFDLSTLESTINDGTANQVNFFEDINGTIPVTSPFNTVSTTIYAIVGNGDCVSFPVEVNLNVSDAPIAIPTTADDCDDGNGMASFDLSTLESTINDGTANQVNFFEDINGTIPVASPFNTASTTIYAIVGNGDCVSLPVAIDLLVLSPTLVNYSDQLCEDESVVINGTTYDINMPIGTEVLVGMANNGCDSIVDIALDFYTPIIGSITGTTNICNGQTANITFNLSGSTSYNVIYSDGINPPVTLSDILDGHTISVSPSNTTTYTLLELSGINIPCDATIPSNEVNISVNNIASEISILSDYQGFGVSCNGMNDGSIEAIPLSGTGPFTYIWENGETSAILENLSAGAYNVSITDALGCTTESTVLLTEPPSIDLSFQTMSPLCFGDTDGAIIIENIEGIGSPFEYSLDGEFFSPVSNLPLIIPSLPSGTYDVTIQDINDCAAEEQVIINAPIEIQVDLGEDITIDLGNSIQLDATVNFDVVDIIWNRQDLGCLMCLDPWVSPLETTNYSITLTDALGCTVTDDVSIIVEKNRNVFIPSVFSPNDDGYNDVFFVNSNQSVLNISNFRIFNRWGETIYANRDIAPNDRSVGWDGTFKGAQLNPSVFVYLVEVEFVDGRVEIYKGDITLVR